MQQKRNKQTQQSNLSQSGSGMPSLNPVSHSKPICITKQLQDSTQLTLQFRPLPSTLTITVFSAPQATTLSLQLTNKELEQMDATVLATFGNLENMYLELVQIVQNYPNDFVVQWENALLRVMITINIKSGSRKRQLVLQMQKRKSTQTQILKHNLQTQQKSLNTRIQFLQSQNKKLHNLLQQQKQHNQKLHQQLSSLRIETEEQVRQLKEAMEEQRKLRMDLMQEFKIQFGLVTDNMGKLGEIVEIINRGGRKIGLGVQGKLKGFQVEYQVQSKTITGKQSKTKAQKITKLQSITPSPHKHTEKQPQKWHQIIFPNPVAQPLCYFQLQITRTKNNYICIGICIKSQCQLQTDSKWSKSAISLFLLDKSIICEGKDMGMSTSKKQLGVAGGKMAGGVVKIRVIIDVKQRNILWQENDLQIGNATFSQEFNKCCQMGQVHPLLICADADDQIVVT